MNQLGSTGGGIARPQFAPGTGSGVFPIVKALPDDLAAEPVPSAVKQANGAPPSEGTPLTVSRGSPLVQPDHGKSSGNEYQVEQTDEARELRDACVSLARRAGDAFSEACESTALDEADSNFSSSKGTLEELWGYAALRDRPFRDLLALLDAALKRTELGQLSDTQRDVIRQAFCDLPRWMLDDSAVEAHIERFADADIDILGPVRCREGQRVRVTFEEITE